MDLNDNPETGSGGTFLKIADGKSVKGVFRGGTRSFYVHWLNNRTVPCTGDDEHCKAGKNQTYRFVINFVVNEGGTFVPKLWEQGATVYQQLKQLNKDYPLESAIMKITRVGTGTDTSYSILPDPNWKIPPGLEARLAKVKLQPLEEKQPESAPPPNDDSGWGSGDPGPQDQVGSGRQGQAFTEDDIPF